jgi:erythrocyte band 7 integral membrane protein
VEVERVEVKDVRVPQQLMRAMAAEAEAARNARAKVIAAEGEHKASRSLRLAAEVIADSPAALQVCGRGMFPAKTAYKWLSPSFATSKP